MSTTPVDARRVAFRPTLDVGTFRTVATVGARFALGLDRDADRDAGRVSQGRRR